MANRARLCAGRENTPRKTQAGDAGMELGCEEEEEGGHQHWSPRAGNLSRSFCSSSDTARGGWMLLVGPKRVLPQVPEVPGSRERKEGFCTETQRVPACKCQTL